MTTVTVPDAALTDIKDALAIECQTLANGAIEDLERYFGRLEYRDVALADARWKLETLGRLAGILRQFESDDNG